MTTNVLFSLLSFASALVIAFFISPYIFRQLGDARYGVWAIFGEVLTYYGLFDLGIRGAVNYFVGRSLAEQRESEVRRYISSAFYSLIAISSVAFLTGLLLVFAFRNTLVTSAADAFEILTAAILFILLFCVGMPIDVFAAVLVGSRRAHLVSSSEIAARLLSTVLMYLGLRYAPGLLVLWFAQLCGKLLYWTLIRWHVHRYVPEARVSFSLAGFGAVRELVAYGGQNAFLNLAWLLINRKDATLITIFLGPTFVASYSFARLIVQSVGDACSAITQALRPNLVYHWAREEFDQAYTIYYTSARYSSFVATSAAAFLVVFGKNFIALWIGERFVTGNPFFRTDVVLYILLAAHLSRIVHSSSWQLLFAANKQGMLAIVVACEGILNLALAIFLVQRFGVVGAAVGTMIPMFLSYVVVMPLLLPRLVGVKPRRYFREGIGRPLLSAVGLAAAGMLIRNFLPANTWPSILMAAAVFGTLVIALGLTFILRPDDRRMLLRRASSLAHGIYSRRARSATLVNSE